MNTAQLEPPRAKDPASSAQPVASPASPHVGRSRWWIYVVLLVALAGFGYFVHNRLESANKAKDEETEKRRAVHALPVVTATARRGNLNQYLIGLGTVTPLNTVTIRSRVDGAIMNVWFTEGQMVKAGDKLVDIDPRPYVAAVQQAQGQLNKDQAAEASAEWNVAQDTQAIKDHSIADQQIHTDTATRDQARGAIEVDKAAIATANLNVTYAHITSPIDGRIGLRLVDVGNIVHATDTTGLAVITQLQPITIVFTMVENDIASIQQRMSTGEPMEVEAYDASMTEKIASGTVLAIDNQIDPTTGMIKLKAQFDNHDNLFSPGQFVNARLLVNTIRNAVLIPDAAIQHSPTSTFVYVVTLDPPAATVPSAEATAAPASSSGRGSRSKDERTGTVKMRDVVTGYTQAAVGSDGESTTVITSGLEPGDVVVTVGVDKLLDGSKVVLHPADSPRTHATTRSSTTQNTGDATTKPAHRKHKTE